MLSATRDFVCIPDESSIRILTRDTLRFVKLIPTGDSTVTTCSIQPPCQNGFAVDGSNPSGAFIPASRIKSREAAFDKKQSKKQQANDEPNVNKTHTAVTFDNDLQLKAFDVETGTLAWSEDIRAAGGFFPKGEKSTKESKKKPTEEEQQHVLVSADIRFVSSELVVLTMVSGLGRVVQYAVEIDTVSVAAKKRFTVLRPLGCVTDGTALSFSKEDGNAAALGGTGVNRRREILAAQQKMRKRASSPTKQVASKKEAEQPSAADKATEEGRLLMSVGKDSGVIALARQGTQTVHILTPKEFCAKKAAEFTNGVAEDSAVTTANHALFRSVAERMAGEGNGIADSSASLAEHGSNFALTSAAAKYDIQTIVSHPTEDMVAVGSCRGELFLFHTFAAEAGAGSPFAFQVFSEHWHHTALKALRFTNDGQSLLTGAGEGVVCLWSLQHFSMTKLCSGLGPLQHFALVNEEPSLIVAMSGDSTMSNIDLVQRRVTVRVDGMTWPSDHSPTGCSVAPFQGFATAILTGLPNTVRIYDVAQRETVQTLHVTKYQEHVAYPPGLGVQSAAMFNNGDSIVTFESTKGLMGGASGLPTVLRWFERTSKKKAEDEEDEDEEQQAPASAGGHREVQVAYDAHNGEEITHIFAGPRKGGDQPQRVLFTVSATMVKCWVRRDFAAEQRSRDLKKKDVFFTENEVDEKKRNIINKRHPWRCISQLHQQSYFGSCDTDPFSASGHITAASLSHDGSLLAIAKGSSIAVFAVNTAATSSSPWKRISVISCAERNFGEKIHKVALTRGQVEGRPAILVIGSSANFVTTCDLVKAEIIACAPAVEGNNAPQRKDSKTLRGSCLITNPPVAVKATQEEDEDASLPAAPALLVITEDKDGEAHCQVRDAATLTPLSSKVPFPVKDVVGVDLMRNANQANASANVAFHVAVVSKSSGFRAVKMSLASSSGLATSQPDTPSSSQKPAPKGKKPAAKGKKSTAASPSSSQQQRSQHPLDLSVSMFDQGRAATKKQSQEGAEDDDADALLKPATLHSRGDLSVEEKKQRFRRFSEFLSTSQSERDDQERRQRQESAQDGDSVERLGAQQQQRQIKQWFGEVLGGGECFSAPRMDGVLSELLQKLSVPGSV